MAVINTNTKALFSQNALKVSGKLQAKSMEQLSTGKRINTAGDDAAGLAISTRMTQQIRALNQSVRNAGDAIALIQTAEGATNEITNMLQRMRELAIQAINDTNSNADRSYLDLEFQQLKQEIVRTSAMTEWNGFKILDGSTGIPVGERPVYKATSIDAQETVFISPTTDPVLGGRDGGPVQILTFDAASTAGTLSLYGVDVTGISATDTDSAVAEKAYRALLADAQFGTASGRTLTLEGSELRISYGVEEVDADVVMPAISGAASASLVSLNAIALDAEGTEIFAANGEFLLAGALEFDVVGTTGTASIQATFSTTRGETITLDGTLDGDEGTVTFDATEGDNSQVISSQLVYRFKDATGSDIDFADHDRTFSVLVNVEGSVPPLRSRDLYINGINIGESSADDDTLSPQNNAAGSAIALAAAINRKTEETGVAAVVNRNIMNGSSMSNGAPVSGYVVVNGYTSAEIVTELNDTRSSREAVVSAINFITHLTGVRAVDSGVDSEGVRLEAEDGRNIEVQFTGLDTTSSIFTRRTGLVAGVQAGTYSLESRVESPVVIATSVTGDLSRARLPLGDFSENISRLVMAERPLIPASASSVSLNSGDLRINGVDIPASRSLDDLDSIASTASSPAASAIAIAAAINRVSDNTGVRAEVYGARLTGSETTVDETGSAVLYINGIEITVDFDSLDEADERVEKIVELINSKTGAHGVQASKTALGGLELVTIDGRNMSVWHDADFESSEFGLGGAYPSSAVTSLANAEDGPAGVSTVYGRITLVSEKPFLVEPGANGYDSDSNFTALGFQEGTFGGEVDEAVSKMTPPRTGRLSFQVGASAGQTITIDLADFGHRGPVTSEITRDVLSDLPTIAISTRAGAESVLADLDVVMDRVNAKRADMGAVMNRLQYAMDNLSNVSMNQEASRSQIQDADYAKASTEMAKSQIMQQAATAVLAQANMSQQTVLQLLQG